MLTSIDPAGGAGAWQLAPVDSTFNAQYPPLPGLEGVACPSTRLCVAVDNDGNVVSSTDPTGGASAWTLTHVDDGINYECYHYMETGPDCQTMFEAVSCPSTGLCVAIDASGQQGESHDPADPSSWTGLDTGGATDQPAVGLACPSVSLCVFVDGDGGDVLIAGENAAPVDPSAGLSGVWCASVSLCFAAEGNSLFLSTNPTGGVTAWKLTGISPSGSITGIACQPASYCVAVDSSGAISVAEILPPHEHIERGLREHLAPIGTDAKIGQLLAHDGCRLRFDAPSAGLLNISWYQQPADKHQGKPKLIATGHATPTARETITMAMRLTRRGQHLLKTARRLKLIAEGAFAPAGNQPVKADKNFPLHR